MRYDPDHKQRTRARVLKAAARAIRAKGPDRVGVAAVMADAGLTRGGFYAHFASKDDLIAAAIDEMFADGARRMRSGDDDASPGEILARYVQTYLSRAHCDQRGGGCPLAALAGDLPRLPRKARRRFGAGMSALRAHLAAQFARLGRADPEADASSLVAELVGALSLARAEPDRAASDAILQRSRAAVLKRFDLETAP